MQTVGEELRGLLKGLTDETGLHFGKIGLSYRYPDEEEIQQQLGQLEGRHVEVDPNFDWIDVIYDSVSKLPESVSGLNHISGINIGYILSHTDVYIEHNDESPVLTIDLSEREIKIDDVFYNQLSLGLRTKFQQFSERRGYQFSASRYVRE